MSKKKHIARKMKLEKKIDSFIKKNKHAGKQTKHLNK